MATLLEAIAMAPLVGVSDAHDSTLHCVRIDGLPVREWGTADHATAACGASVKLLEGGRWAPRINGTPFVRCKLCEAVAGKRVRSRWQRREVVA